MKKYIISFINQNIKIEVDDGTTVSKACDMAGFPLNLVCNGMGTCGKCKVTIEDDIKKSTVLACITKIKSDLNIYLNDENYLYQANILENLKIDNEVELNPSLSKSYKDIKNIKKMENGYLNCCDLYILKKFSRLINEKSCNGITYINYNDKIIDVQSDDTRKYLYGASVDIGTTSVVLYIFDLNTGEMLKTYSDLNMQISMGADVISRIMYAQNSKNGLSELNEKIIHTINILLDKAILDCAELKDNLYNIVFCGNSAMQHFLFDLSPDSLGYSPFSSITKDYIECFGNDISLNVPDRCKIIFLPILGGFVGSDTTSVLLAMPNDCKKRLIIDLGTNGEIAVGNIDGYLVASTACGPALECGSIECGMRGTFGAIERFKIEKEGLVLKVIGNVKPKGICGSGIIDLIAELLSENIIDQTGRMVTKEEFTIKKPESKLCDRLIKINEINCFMISKNDSDKVYISQKDIRQIQLAKSSIYSGCMSLIEADSLRLNKIDEVVISGAFGNYIDIDNAMFIGLIPAVDKSKVNNIGNGAGKGVSLYIINKDMKDKCDKIINNSTHYELANDANFVESYISNMNFLPHKY
jgi:uncharacterized 2Fe-2S/4Fe-4S cluster protein (DUF4445 family)